MKSLTVCEPFATLLTIGAKSIETRSWATTYTGWLAIHASKTTPAWAKDYFRHSRFAREAFERAEISFHALPLGCVIGRVYLYGCRRVEGVRDSLSEQERDFGDYSDGRYAWLTRNPLRHEPIAASGRLGLWKWEPPVGLRLGEVSPVESAAGKLF